MKKNINPENFINDLKLKIENVLPYLKKYFELLPRKAKKYEEEHDIENLQTTLWAIMFSSFIIFIPLVCEIKESFKIITYTVIYIVFNIVLYFYYLKKANKIYKEQKLIKNKIMQTINEFFNKKEYNFLFRYYCDNNTITINNLEYLLKTLEEVMNNEYKKLEWVIKNYINYLKKQKTELGKLFNDINNKNLNIEEKKIKNKINDIEIELQEFEKYLYKIKTEHLLKNI